jgi:hypothetical protein
MNLTVNEPENYTWDGLKNSINHALNVFEIYAATMSESEIAFSCAYDVRITFESPLAEYLGVDVISIGPDKTYTLHVDVHLEHMHKLMVVKTNVVEPYQYENKLCSVIKTLFPPSEEGQRLDRFENMEYYPVSRKRFEEIEFEITDDCGDPYNFEGGSVSAVLRFRAI